ncbi:hypothetical protein HAZT_HAZT003366 [Hyalella azteca]|nr:tRNA methyltransferase 10 homolog A isoform X2 [Hyalella azteca]XP_047739387.1 tRNA methyltransferase 10 homolog A isoform X2 [Hyalella azteca]XP_047739388.1 tRNA methyltransferase 10 homolog A isoform X2 [Hyalella azteca]KAA0190622.1 hypothetical protein HAZT_HAZT003366 [Hyalella azteca]
MSNLEAPFDSTVPSICTSNSCGEDIHQGTEEPPVKIALGISKRQKKKLEKKQKWLATKEERKQKERERLKLKRKAKREAGIELGPSRKLLKLCTMANSNCKQRIVIDMSYDGYMNEKDLCKSVKQLHRCYSSNRRAKNPAQLYVTSFHGPSAQIMERNNGFKNWDIHFKEESYLDLFFKKDVVYLSSDSENVVNELDENKIYVIGGLVDHNNHKGLCHRLACENEVNHARLPINEFMKMKTRQVLTIDHVFQILLAVTEGKSWKNAFLGIIPARKGATALDDSNECI